MTDPKAMPDGVAPAAQVVQLVIEFSPQSGSVNVQAPRDPILCYGLLEIAKQIITKRDEGELKQSPIMRI